MSIHDTTLLKESLAVENACERELRVNNARNFFAGFFYAQKEKKLFVVFGPYGSPTRKKEDDEEVGNCSDSVFTGLFGDVVDVQFSPGGDAPGGWHYDGYTTLSFDQVIDIDVVCGGTSDSLFDQWVYIPNLTFSNSYSTVTPSGPIEIKDNSGNVLLKGKIGQ